MKRGYIDISMPLHNGAIVYPGDPSFHLEALSRAGAGAAYTLSSISLGTHTGTHIDAPAHFIPDGKTIDEYPAERFIIEALVVSVDAPSIGLSHLPEERLENKAVLFKTANSAALAANKRPEHPCLLSREAAAELVRRGVTLVGIDWLSVEEDETGEFPVHTLLLERGILILESVILSQVRPGRYLLYCPPLPIRGAEAAPARAVLAPFPSE